LYSDTVNDKIYIIVYLLELYMFVNEMNSKQNRSKDNRSSYYQLNNGNTVYGMYYVVMMNTFHIKLTSSCQLSKTFW
jgi:hypothetical protein